MTNKSKQHEHWKVFVLLLKETACEKGITQEQIAADTGFTQSNVSRVFSLRYKPTLDTFLRIAQAVGGNFSFEDVESKIDLSILFERAMTELSRR